MTVTVEADQEEVELAGYFDNVSARVPMHHVAPLLWKAGKVCARATHALCGTDHGQR